MNNQTTVARAMPAQPGKDRLPAIAKSEQQARDVTSIAKAVSILRRAADCFDFVKAEELLRDVQPIVQRIDAVLDQLESALVPATMGVIAQNLAELVGAFPNAAKADLAAFGKMLAADVGAMRPSRGAVEQACRHLRRISKFIPAIAEVIEAIEAAEHQFRGARSLARNLPQLYAEAKHRRDQAEQRHEEQRKELLSDARCRLEDGKGTAGIPADIVRAVRREPSDNTEDDIPF